MIRHKLPQILVLSTLVFLLAAAQPAAAISSLGRAEPKGVWAEARELWNGVLQAIGLGAPEHARPSRVTANAGANLDPDGAPGSAPNGAGTVSAGESH